MTDKPARHPYLNLRRVFWVVGGEAAAGIGGGLSLIAVMVFMKSLGIQDGEEMLMGFSVIGMLAIVAFAYTAIKRAWDWQDKRIKGDRP